MDFVRILPMDIMDLNPIFQSTLNPKSPDFLKKVRIMILKFTLRLIDFNPTKIEDFDPQFYKVKLNKKSNH